MHVRVITKQIHDLFFSRRRTRPLAALNFKEQEAVHDRLKDSRKKKETETYSGSRDAMPVWSPAASVIAPVDIPIYLDFLPALQIDWSMFTSPTWG